MKLRRTYSESLARLLKGVCNVPSGLDTFISGLSLDSRLVKRGDLFLALSPCPSNAAVHIKEAIDKGANAVVAQGSLNQGLAFEDGLTVELYIDNLKQKVGLIADRFYRSPSSDMSVIGVTGTNGKTSVTNYLAQYFASEASLSGLIGTLGYGLLGEDSIALKETGYTTPNVVEVHRCLAELRDAGVTNVFMEVSSHGLSQGRVDGVRFEGAVFTNLSREHLDYHGSMEAYAQSKFELFKKPGLKFAVINDDDHYAGQLREQITQDIKVLSYGVKTQADISVLNYQLMDGPQVRIKAQIATPDGEFSIRSGLMGAFNLSNLLAVVAVASAKHAVKNCEQRIKALRAVDGRMQMLTIDGGPSIVVDYAHTPDALENALIAVKPHCQGRLIVVFGCGGDRDAGKRPEMAVVAERLADTVIVTDDNPRYESPQQITQDIFSGFQNTKNVSLIHDRALAINEAVAQAISGDLVLIAGKGHETWQEFNGQKVHFSDIEVIQGMLKGTCSSKQSKERSA